ncbi:MAG: type II toxin-antitoxin system HicB family antitoxin, partial [Spirochaetales bacterium]|nr:type II toxin-antitoxin system HicB family antitoxin [Spirochaetales bacterium]
DFLVSFYIQPKGSKAKVYQVKQIRGIILKHKLGGKTLIRYEMIIYWSREDGAFIVEVLELPGCMADGSTY